MAVVGIGVDAVEIARVRAAVIRTPGLLARLFTENERATCTTRCGDLRHGGLAARFAAKEAVVKALGGRDFSWRDIEVRTDVDGRPRVVLHDAAARRAAALGVTDVHVSLTTSQQIAVASVVAEAVG